jgi:hypothetical protein
MPESFLLPDDLSSLSMKSLGWARAIARAEAQS